MHSLVAISYGLRIEGIRLMLFGGVSELSDEPHSPKAEFTMAIVGPLSSLVLGGIFYSIYYLSNSLSISVFIAAPALWLGFINVLLGVFNLLPGFPLDGGRVFRSIIWRITGDFKRSTGIAVGLGKLLAYMMIFGGAVGPFMGNFSLIWFALIGFYLLRAADVSYQQVIIKEALGKVEVKEAMTANPETVDPDTSLADVAEHHFRRHRWVAYPVVKEGSVLGIVTVDSLNAIPEELWRDEQVKDIMQPINSDFVVDPETSVAEALEKLGSKAERRILVMRDSELLGILSKVDVGRVIGQIELNEEQ
jgi:Zn-dependent protease/predicted transcriptional regulator